MAVALILLTLKKNAVAQKIWFAPGVALLLGNLFNWIDYGYFSVIWIYWIYILFSLVEIGGLILIGLWVKEHDSTSPKAEPINEYSNFDSQDFYSVPLSNIIIGGADKLKTCSELLELGIITQEEFNAKKKQILGL